MLIKLLIHIYKYIDEYKVASFNVVAILFSLLETSKILEKILQIIMLLASIIYTGYKIHEAERKRRKNKKDE